MMDIEEMARNLSGQTGATYMAWLDALSEGVSLQTEAQLDERSFMKLIEACKHPRQLALLVEALDEHAKEHPDNRNGFISLASHADDSSYSLNEWVVAVEYLYDWLAQAKRVSPSFTSLLEYISCCSEAGSSAPAGYPLVGLVEEMLDRYGIESE